MKKSILLVLFFLSLVTLSIATTSVSATDYTKVGVKVGDTTDYAISDPTPNGTLTGTFYIKILNITGVNVTFDIRPIYDPNNLEEYENIYTHNVSSVHQFLIDGSEPVLPPPYLVAANLSQGENIFQDEKDPFLWSPIETITMIVAGQYREVNHVTFTGPVLLPCLRPGDKWSWSYDAYYDKVTGLLVATDWARSGVISPYQNGSKASYTTILTSTTAFTGLNTTGPTILPSEETTVSPQIITAAIALIAVTVPVAITIATVTITQRRKQKTTTN